MRSPKGGFALRKNGTCARSEVDCGITNAPFRVCCPESTFCPKAYNVDCCPTNEKCTEDLLKEPSCADSSWDLYDNDGYFCCMKGLRGYNATRTYSSRCAAPGYAFEAGEILLELIKEGTEDTSSSSLGLSQTTATPSESARSSSSTDSSHSQSTLTCSEGGQSSACIESNPGSKETSDPSTGSTLGNDSKDSSTNTGAIAGGVVGGVVGVLLIAIVAWLLLKRRKKSAEATVAPVWQKPQPAWSEQPRFEMDATKNVAELPAEHQVHEAQS